MAETKASSLADVPRSSAGSGSDTTVSNVDAAWKFLDANRNLDGIDYTDGELKKLRRKIDLHIVPMMFCCYTMQFLDKVILNVSDPLTYALRHKAALGRDLRSPARLPSPAGSVMLTCRSFSMLLSWASARSLN